MSFRLWDSILSAQGPLFEEVVVERSGKQPIKLKATDNNRDNRYIQSICIDGKQWSKNYFTFDQLSNSGEITFEMGGQPNYQRGTMPSDAPYSLSNE